MKRRLTYPPSLRDQRIASKNALDYYADSAGKPRADIVIAPKRERLMLKGDVVPEADIQKAILDYLKTRKDVVFFGRFNRGAAFTQAGRPIYFNSVKGFPDIHGVLRRQVPAFNRALPVPFYLEVKRAGEVATEDQAEFLNSARSGGCIAEVVYSVTDVARYLT